MPPAVLATLIAATPSPSPGSTSSLDPIPNPGAYADAFASELAETRCTRDDVSICGVVFRVTGQEDLGKVLDVLLGTPLRVLLIVLVGLVARSLLHRVIGRLAERIAAGTATNASGASGGPAADRSGGSPDGQQRAPAAGLLGASPLLSTRRAQRSRTLASVLRSVTTGVIGAIVVLMVLDELGFSVAPLLASAGVVGVALGFGCQALVRDFVSGIFMIIEDQYGVGDVVDLGEAIGTVEAVGLRVTRVRDVNGTVWYVRNGEILRVGNQSQGWSRAVLDVAVGYGEDIDRAQDLLRATALQVHADERFGALMLEEPEVWGVEQLTPEAVIVRVVARTQPLQQWVVARELRRRFTTALERAGVTVPAQPWAMAAHAHPDGATDAPHPAPGAARAAAPAGADPAASPGSREEAAAGGAAQVVVAADPADPKAPPAS